MKTVSNTINVIITLVVLVSSIGVPVILEHVHNPNFIVEEGQEMLCQDAVSCCGTEIVDEVDENILLESTCNCNLLASCCCCYLELELVTFSFDTPLIYPLSSPVFLEAYSTDLFTATLLSSDLSYSINRLEFPPPLPYSQKLALFQVFRI